MARKLYQLLAKGPLTSEDAKGIIERVQASLTAGDDVCSIITGENLQFRVFDLSDDMEPHDIAAYGVVNGEIMSSYTHISNGGISLQLIEELRNNQVSHTVKVTMSNFGVATEFAFPAHPSMGDALIELGKLVKQRAEVPSHLANHSERHTEIQSNVPGVRVSAPMATLTECAHTFDRDHSTGQYPLADDHDGSVAD